MSLSGHQHDLFVFEPGVVTPNEKLKYHGPFGSKTYKGYLTDFNFPNLLISKRGYTQTDNADLTKVKSQIGLKIVVGRLQKEKKIKYSQLNHLKEKYDIDVLKY